MATNDFLPFANGGSANVLTQAQYAALTSLLQSGFQSGVAQSIQVNKVLRQGSIMAAVLAQFAADYSGQNSTDDGTTATLEANLVAAIRSATKTGVILADTGAANAYTVVNVPPLTSGTWVDGVVQQVKIAHANTGASTYAPDGLTAIPIYGLGLQPLQGGELALNGIAVLMHATIAGVNSGNPIAVLMECAGGAQQIAAATQSQQAVNLGQFANFLVTNGYSKLPNGLILQWGTGTLPNSGARTSTVAVTLPLTWPGATLLSAVGNANGAANSSVGGLPVIGATSNTSSSITFTADTLGYTTFNQTMTFLWFAIGK